MKLKIFKKLISVLCAATVATASVAPSVGAFKAPANAQEDVVNSVNQLNERLKELNNKINGMLEITNREVQKYLNSNDYDRQVKLATLLSNLETAKQNAAELNEVVVDNSAFANNLRNKIIEIVATQQLAWGETNPQVCNYFPENYFDVADGMREKLKNIKKMLKENNNNNLANLKKDFKAKSKEFYDRWTKHTEFDKQIGNYGKNNDPTYQDRQDANYWCNKAFNNGNEQAMRKAIECCNKAIDSMNKYESDHNLANLKKDFEAKAKEFYARWKKHTAFDKQIGNYGKNNDPTYQDRRDADKWCNKAFNNGNEQAMRKAIECCNKAIDSMNKYESDHNLANLKKDFEAKAKEFYARWEKHTAFDKLIGKYGKKNDPTYQDRQKAHYWCNNAFGSENEQAMRKAIECCNKAIDSMNKYENDNAYAFNYMNLHQLNVFLGDGVANNSADAVEHDKALMKKLKDAWDSHDDLYPALSDLREVLESDSFKDKKAGAEFLAGLINDTGIDGGEGAWLFSQVILPVLPDKINEFKNLYINKGGKKFVNELGNIDQKIAKVLEETPHVWLWHGSGLNGIVNYIFKNAFGKVTDDCYKKFRETGDKEWNPMEVDLANLDNMISRIEKKRKSMKATEFAAGRDFKRFISDFKVWFLGKSGWLEGIEGIYKNLTGRSYLNEVDEDGNYKGKYVVLKNLYDSLLDLATIYAEGDADGIEEHENDIKEQIETIRESSRQVVQFFNNNH